MPKSTPTINNKPKKRLSITRLLLLLLIIGSLSYGIVLYSDEEQRTEIKQAIEIKKTAPAHKPWFAAYVDVTSTPIYPFEKPAYPTQPDVVLSFIVASENDSCLPTWGNYYTLKEAANILDLDRRIARLQQLGGSVAVSFGGALNSELALSCEDHDQLKTAYKSIIEHYQINTLDLDLENESLRNTEANTRRAKAISELQKEYRDNDKDLAIWLTLPVAPQGMTKEGTDAVAAMLKEKVDLAGVNLMTMDYGGSKDPKDSMFESSKKALQESHRQLGVLYKQAGIGLNGNSIWKKIGATPMIGQNDVIEEIFSVEDAIAFNQFAVDQGIGRMSMWSANRDIPCGENYVDVKVVSDSCSGVKDQRLSFTKTLSTNFLGDLVHNADMLTIEDPEVNIHTVDDPKTSPYQIWIETGAYNKGTKVVWHGHVFEAKWWTKNDLPDSPVLQAWETPWRLIGPVLSGETPIQLPKLPARTYPTWSGRVIYDSGDRVLFEGTPYQAKWWNQGESPAAAAAYADNSPWLQLSQKQVIEILEKLKN